MRMYYTLLNTSQIVKEHATYGQNFTYKIPGAIKNPVKLMPNGVLVVPAEGINIHQPSAKYCYEKLGHTEFTRI